MSRIGKKPVEVPAGVKVDLIGRTITVSGPKGKLSWEYHRKVEVKVDNGKVTVNRTAAGKLARALHGTTRQLIQNMVQGVSEGFKKRLDIVGVGYNAKVQGKKLVLAIGFCHPVEFDIPEGIELEIPQPTHVVVRGMDKQMVGQFAAEIRRVRPPEPYKGKGIMYQNEVIRRKATKSFGST
ncbi:MAG: 50S ribosomal protein L6 [Planctomycetota bacterium]